MEVEDKEKIINGVRPVVIKMKRVDSLEVIQDTFIERVRENLHMVLGMSPVGDVLRIRCRRFPSLVSTCALDWFSRWPEDALRFVSSSFLADVDLPSEQVRTSIADMCSQIHRDVEEGSERFYE